MYSNIKEVFGNKLDVGGIFSKSFFQYFFYLKSKIEKTNKKLRKTLENLLYYDFPQNRFCYNFKRFNCKNMKISLNTFQGNY